jgi:hypothetical protein
VVRTFCARNMSISYVHADEAGALVTLARRSRGAAVWGRRHRAKTVHLNQTYRAEGLVSAYPRKRRQPIFVSERRIATVSVFSDPLDRDSWAYCTTPHRVHPRPSSSMQSRTRHVPRVLLAMFGSVDLPPDRASALDPASGLPHPIVLIALYTSIMAQVLLVNTMALDTFAGTKRAPWAISVTQRKTSGSRCT